MASRLARLLLALALLAGWQLSLVHPLKHHDAQGGYVHLGGGHSNDGKSGPADGSCDAIAALAACVAAAAAALPPECCADSTPLSLEAARRLAGAAPPFLSQGPPVFL